jgi:glutamyl-tRNA reductase
VSVLVVGLSHKSAPVATLERAVVSGDALTKLLRDVSQAGNVAGVFVVSTCNRVEVYAEVDKFHGGVTSISELLARHSGLPLSELTAHLYVHYEDRAVQHLLAVACGLESLVVGESQILGQVRQSLGLAREQGTLSRILGDLGTLALRTAKRAHTETGIDRAGANLVGVGIGLAVEHLPAPADPAVPLRGRAVLVIGAGSMSSLAATTAARMGAFRIVVANRTPDRARRLAAAVSGTTADLDDMPGLLAAADLVISCTGSAGLVISADDVTRALRLRQGRPGDGNAAGDGEAARGGETTERGNVAGGGQAAGGGETTERGGPAPRAGRPLVLLDLALPRDVEEAAGRRPGVSLVSLATIGEAGDAGQVTLRADVAAVREIVAEEFDARVSAEHAARVAPTVVALRAKAAEVVDAEIARLAGRLNTLDARTHGEVARAMRRVVDKLLHSPTVRVKELAGSPGGDSYENALRVLFDLDPAAIDAVTRADVGLVRPAGPDGPAPHDAAPDPPAGPEAAR